MWIGYCCEGTDVPILHCLMCRLLGLPEEAVDHIEAPVRKGRGCTDVLRLVPNELKRFYTSCSIAAVIGIDNDGYRPCHYVHVRGGSASDPACPFCRLLETADRTRPTMQPVERFVAQFQWPIIISVPVQALEAWLLTALRLSGHGVGDLYAETRPETRADRDEMKRLFYGPGMVTDKSVENTALPLLRGLADVRAIANSSNSFREFAEQVDAARPGMEQCAQFLGGAHP